MQQKKTPVFEYTYCILSPPHMAKTFEKTLVHSWLYVFYKAMAAIYELLKILK